MTKAKWIGALGALATTVMAPAAFADSGLGTTGQGYGTVGALLGFGTSDYDLFGLGVRGGYTLPMNVYVGGLLQYNFGSDHFHSFEFGAEGGYDIDVGPVVIRPYLGLGYYNIGYSVDIPTVSVAGITAGGGNISGSQGYFALWPGAVVMYPIQNFFVGGDVRFNIVPSANEDAVSFGVYATGGLQF